MATISIEELRDLCTAALLNAGMREEDVVIAVDHYLENEMSGKASHGVIRVIEASKTVQKQNVSRETLEIEQDTGTIVTVNAKGNVAVVAGRYAMDIAVGRAKTHGIALVGVRNYIASMGSMAYFLRRFADQGLIALMGCNSVALVSPPAGRERMIGTNPVGIAVPGADGDHLIADFSTSAIAYGKIMVLKDKNEPVPEGVLIDKDGNPSTTPEDAYDGAILPLADYRGFALGLMVELLAGPLIGASAIKKDLYDNDGMFMIVIDPKKAGNADYAAQVKAALAAVRNSPPAPGETAVPLPGERSGTTLAETKARGTVEMVDKTLQDLRALAVEKAA